MSISSHFFAGRSLDWRQVGISLFSTSISTVAVVGLAGGAYASGVAVFNYEWMAAVVLAVFAAAFLPRLYVAGDGTAGAQLARRYDARIGVILNCVTVFLGVALDAAGGVYAGARLLAPAIHIPFAAACVVLALGAAAIAAAGGLRLIVRFQMVQFVVLLAACAVVAWAALQAAGSWEAALAGVDPDRLSLIRPAADPVLPWTGLVLGAPILSFYFWCSNQVMVQRVLSARSLQDAQVGCMLAGLLKLSSLFLLVLPGVMAGKLLPGLAQADQAYAALIARLLPGPAGAAVVVVLVLAVLTSAAASLNATATVLALDFIKPRLAAGDDAAVVRASRWCVLLAAVAVAVWAPQIGRFTSLWTYMQAMLAYVTPPFVALFIVGGLSRTAAKAGFPALMAGFACGAALLAARGLGAQVPHFLVCAFLIFCVSAGVLLALAGGRGERIAAPRPSPVFVLSAVFVLGLTAALVWLFR